MGGGIEEGGGGGESGIHYESWNCFLIGKCFTLLEQNCICQSGFFSMFYDKQSKEGTDFYDALDPHWYWPMAGYDCEGCHLALDQSTGRHSLLEKFPVAKYMRKVLFGVEPMLRSTCDIFGYNIWTPDGMCKAYCPGGVGEPVSQQYYWRDEAKLINYGFPKYYRENAFESTMAIIQTREPTMSECKPPLACLGMNLGGKWMIQERPSEPTQNFRRPGFSPCHIRCCLLVCE